MWHLGTLKSFFMVKSNLFGPLTLKPSSLLDKTTAQHCWEKGVLLLQPCMVA
jgi:hypothetical protein